jgi:uncharacterized protein (DUF1800 family)
MPSLKIMRTAFCFVSLFGIISCQQQTSNIIATGNTAKKPVLSSYNSSGAVSANDYQYSNAQLDVADLDQIMTFEDAARFESRIGIGAPMKRVNRYIGKPRRDAINLVVSELENYQDEFLWPDWVNNVTPISFFERAKKRNRFYCGEAMFEDSLRMELSKRLLTSQIPQFERLFLFWLDHFSVEFKAYSQSHAFAEHMRLIRKNSNQSFLDLLRNVVNDPGMIVYLNNDSSSAKKPNENLAREFLELFSLGEGKYNEKDIKTLAKAIAPYGINFVSEKPNWFSSKASGRDFDAFGQSYKTFDEFVWLIAKRADFGEMIAKKFYREFVSVKPPKTNDIAILMSKFRSSNFSIPKLFEATISLKSFWSEESRLNIVKSPLELLYGTARTLGYVGQELDYNRWMLTFATELGQDLFNPPNVAGFPGGTAWVSGQMMEKRIELINRIFGDFSLSSVALAAEKQMTNMDVARSRGQQSRLKEIESYRSERAQFFKNLKEDQLGVETILLNEVSRDFEKHRWRKIEAVFYNVQLNGKKWDGITIRFGNDKNDKGKYGDHLRVEQGKSNPDAFSKSAFHKSFTNDRGLRTLKFSYPSGGDQRRMPSSIDDKLLIERLSQAMLIVLDHDRAYSQLSVNSAAQKWLRQFIKKVGWKKLNSNGQSYPPAKMFAIATGSGSTPYPKMRNFLCGFNQAKHNFIEARQIPKEFDRFSLSGADIAIEDQNLIKLLLPDLYSRLGPISVKQALMHEGYQLR